MGADDKLWMIDWGSAGTYPPGFEQAILREQSGQNEGFAEMVLSKLSDRQERMVKMWYMISYGLTVGANL